MGLNYYKLFLSLFILLVASLTVNFSPANAQTSTSGHYRECLVSPTSITPGNRVTLTIRTDSYELHANTIVENRSTGQSYGSSVAPSIDESSPRTERSITLGPFNDLGQYYIRSIDLRNTGRCELFPAFTVNSSSTSSSANLVQPVSPITQTDMRTLPELFISGLTPGWEYTIKLSGWKGADLVHSQISGAARYRFMVESGGTLRARNICNNGQADRVSDPCTDPFGPGMYGLTIYQLDGTQVKYLEFCVVSCTGGYSHSGPAGVNPCVGGNCNTAIGTIPTDPTAFVGRLITIAISLAGGIALIIMVIGSVKILMSANDPQKVANGRDMIIAAVAGLLFLIFSVLILRYLGSNLFGFFTVT